MAKKRGSTFLEVSIAMLLLAVVTGSVFSVAISAKRGSGRSMRRLVADQVSRQLSEKLKGYVSGDRGQAPFDLGFRGPSGGGTAAANWSINGSPAMDGTGIPPINGTITDSQGAVPALAFGTHTLTGVLPPWFAGAPYNATIRYVVTYMQTFSAGNMAPEGVGLPIETRSIPQVEVYVDWTEPQ
ncbi:MAG: hypothetical protein HY748_10195 [Elusimicrobia bacterium]|nr:hypothetical protein [Elusimicrobiota bacterium]